MIYVSMEDYNRPEGNKTEETKISEEWKECNDAAGVSVGQRWRERCGTAQPQASAPVSEGKTSEN